MALMEMSPEELSGYRPDIAEPDDFDQFWADTLGDLARPQFQLSPMPGPIDQLIVEDLTFTGFNDEPIRAWVIRPRSAQRLPAVIEFIGYNGGRGLPAEHLHWAASGFVHIVMDTRGQGSGWGGGGSTADPHGSGPAVEGFLTRGIDDPHHYFYRRVYVDGVRLVETSRHLPFVDANRIALTGGSQGGGITLAVAGLVGDSVIAAMPNSPFLCHFRRAVAVAASRPFSEITQYLSVHRDEVASVFATLSYFDGAIFAKRCLAPALFSVGLMDEIVPPSCVYATYNRYGSTDRQIDMYEFNGHEAGQFMHWQREVAWLRQRL